MMSPIIFLFLRVSIPAGIGFAVHEALKGKLGKYAPGAAAHAGYLGFILSGVIIGLVGGHFTMGTLAILLLLAAIAGMGWMVAQPGTPPALLIMGLNAWAVIAILIDLPKLFHFGFYFWMLVFTAAGLAFSVLPIVFLAKTLQEKN